MKNNQKKIVSMRISESDHMKIKRIAKRLQTKDSDVIRFAIKTALAKLSPLDRQDRSGSDVLPAFLEIGKELTNFFNLDADKLYVIINNNEENPEQNIDMRDIELIAMSALPEHFLQGKIQGIIATQNDGKENIDNVLREYLYEKYIRISQQTVETVD